MKPCLKMVFMLGVLVATHGRGEEPEKSRDDRIAEFITRCETERKAALKAWPEDFKRESKRLADMRKGPVGEKNRKQGAHNFDSKEEKEAAVKEQAALIEKMKASKKQLETNEPPFVAAIDAKRSLRVGDIGTLGVRGVRCVEVVDDENMLADAIWYDNAVEVRGRPGSQYVVPRPNEHRQQVWIEGVATTGVVDDEFVTLPQCFEVTGTKKFGGNTVLLLKIVDLTPHFPKKGAKPTPMKPAK